MRAWRLPVGVTLRRGDDARKGAERAGWRLRAVVSGRICSSGRNARMQRLHRYPTAWAESASEYAVQLTPPPEWAVLRRRWEGVAVRDARLAPVSAGDRALLERLRLDFKRRCRTRFPDGIPGRTSSRCFRRTSPGVIIDPRRNIRLGAAKRRQSLPHWSGRRHGGGRHGRASPCRVDPLEGV